METDVLHCSHGKIEKKNQIVSHLANTARFPEKKKITKLKGEVNNFIYIFWFQLDESPSLRSKL